MDNKARVSHSVVIPTRNHPKMLSRCLDALIKTLSPSWKWEALIMDNSEDEFRVENQRVVDSFSRENFSYRFITLPGLMSARHQGVEAAQGDIVSFIDDDTFVTESWLLGIEKAFTEPSVVLVGGPNRPLYETIPPEWLTSLWTNSDLGQSMGYLSLLDFGNSERTISPLYVWGCNYSFRKNIFLEVGGSHPDYMPTTLKRFQGDGETALSVKISAKGYSALYSPLCAIHHFVPESRLTIDYFGSRAYFIGLHLSFTQIRREHGLGPDKGVPLIESLSLNRVLRTVTGRIKRCIFGIQKKRDREETKLKQFLHARLKNGWDYHRREVMDDPALLKYVISDNFLKIQVGYE